MTSFYVVIVLTDYSYNTQFSQQCHTQSMSNQWQWLINVFRITRNLQVCVLELVLPVALQESTRLIRAREKKNIFLNLFLKCLLCHNKWLCLLCVRYDNYYVYYVTISFILIV